jgi:hypothetical protein
MGQYWKPVNLDRKEFISPHKLGAGLKLWEQLAAHPGTAAALIVLCAAMPNGMVPGPMPESYPEIAAQVIGRWAGDRIALVGDYAEDGDLAAEHQASTIYDRCVEPEWEEEAGTPEADRYTDITDLVARVLEHELGGTFTGTGWRNFRRNS